MSEKKAAKTSAPSDGDQSLPTPTNAVDAPPVLPVDPVTAEVAHVDPNPVAATPLQPADPVTDDVAQALLVDTDNADMAQALPVDAAPMPPSLFTVQVVKSPTGKRFRAGMSFTSEVSDPIDFRTLSREQIDALANDPFLRIRRFEA